MLAEPIRVTRLVIKARLDQAYLRRWASELGVADLLEEALNQGDSESAK